MYIDLLLINIQTSVGDKKLFLPRPFCEFVTLCLLPNSQAQEEKVFSVYFKGQLSGMLVP